MVKILAPLLVALPLIVGSCGDGLRCVISDGGDARCQRTLAAAEVVDDLLEARGLRRVAGWMDVVWVEGSSFQFEAEGGPGQDLYGRCQLTVAEGGRCLKFLATRGADAISPTSLPHEALHCALTVSLAALDGDHDHSLPIWGEFVPAARLALEQRGL